MFAFVVNAVAVVIGSALGLIFKKFIKKDIFDTILKAIGVVVLLFGIAGVLRYMFKIEFDPNTNNYSISTINDLMFIIVIALGTFIGSLINIDLHLHNFGDYVEKKFKKSSFSEGFVSATLIFCVGAMSIVGSVSSAVGDSSIIYLKSAIDAVTAVILASTLGFGVIFSSVSIIIYQGALTLIAYFLGDFITADFIAAFSMVGYSMVVCIGLNFIIKDKIKVANMLPSLILIILYFLVFK